MAVRVGYHRSPVQAGLDSVAPYDHESSVMETRSKPNNVMCNARQMLCTLMAVPLDRVSSGGWSRLGCGSSL